MKNCNAALENSGAPNDLCQSRAALENSGAPNDLCQSRMAPLAALRENPNAEAVYTVYADGSSLGNPGPGGWAYAIIAPDGSRTTRAGAAPHVTNNQMEIQAAIEALKGSCPHPWCR